MRIWIKTDYYRENKKEFVKYVNGNVVLYFDKAEIETYDGAITLSKEDLVNPRIVNGKLLITEGDEFKMKDGQTLYMPEEDLEVFLREGPKQAISINPRIYATVERIGNKYRVEIFPKDQEKKVYIMDKRECRNLIPISVRIRVCL